MSAEDFNLYVAYAREDFKRARPFLGLVHKGVGCPITAGKVMG
jgi:hypothetical protein